MREFVHYQGDLRLAFDLQTCPADLVALLLRTAPAINYLGKRGGFIQYLGYSQLSELDGTYTQPAEDLAGSPSAEDDRPTGQRAMLDDFGAGATFEALNSFSSAEIRLDVHRKFVETLIPLRVYNAGPGFVHYRVPDARLYKA